MKLKLNAIFRQNRKLRDSSNESDEDDLHTPPPRSVIDGSNNVLPSKIKAAAVSFFYRFLGKTEDLNWH